MIIDQLLVINSYVRVLFIVPINKSDPNISVPIKEFLADLE